MSFEIRSATKADIVSIQSLIIEANNNHASVLVRPEEDIRLHIECFLVAVEDTTIIGCVAVDAHSEILGEIRTQIVRSTHQGQGIGTRLIDHAFKEGLKRYKALWIDVTKTKLFTERYGFKPIPRYKMGLRILVPRVLTVLTQHPKQWSKALSGSFTLLEFNSQK